MVDSDSGRHVDLEILLQLAAGQLAPHDAAAVERHCEACGPCRAELALARSFVEASDAPPPAELHSRMRARFQAELDRAGSAADASARRSPASAADGAGPVSAPPSRGGRATRGRSAARGRGTAVGWLAAASIVAIGAVTWQAVQTARQPRPTGVERGTPGPTAWTPTVSVLSDGRLEIAWTPIAQADAYRVEVATVAGRIVWQARTTDTRVQLPWDALSVEGDPIPPLLVRIFGTGPDGFRRESDRRQLPVPAPGATTP